MVIPVVKAAFRPGFAFRRNPANHRVSEPCGLERFGSWMVREPHPNQARYHLRYTRIFSFCYYTTRQAKIKDFPVCGHSCGQGRFSARFHRPVKLRKRPCFRAFRSSSFRVVDEVETTPKCGAVPTPLHPDIQF